MTEAIVLLLLFLLVFALQLLATRGARSRAAMMEDALMAAPAPKRGQGAGITDAAHRAAPVGRRPRQPEARGTRQSEPAMLRQGIVMSEILGPPLALRGPGQHR